MGRPCRKHRGEVKCIQGQTEGKRPLRNLGVDVRIILIWILKKYDGSAWTGVMWFKVGTSGKTFYVG
jgi:hypothetical protein